MAFRRSRQTVLLAKIEAAARVYEQTAPADDAVVIREPTIRYFDAEYAEIKNYSGDWRQYPQAAVSKFGGLSCSYDIAGAGGAVDVPTQFSRFWRACGLREVVTVGQWVEYTPRIDNFETLSVDAYVDGMRARIVGAVGEGKIMFAQGDVAMAEIDLTGAYTAPADVATPGGIVLTGYKTPLAAAGNTQIGLHGINVDAASFEWACGNSIEKRVFLGQEEQAIIMDATPVGKITFDWESVAAKDWLGIVDARTTGALLVEHGGAIVGKRIRLSAPQVALTNPDFPVENGVQKISFDLVPTTPADGTAAYTIRTW